VPLGRILAIGDQFNDLEMLAGVGHGAAMSGAPGAVQAAARYLAPPVTEEGAAQLIEQLVLADPEVAARNADALAARHSGATVDVAPDAADGERTATNQPNEADPPLIGARRA
jgi:hypothetical protein